MRQSCKHTVKSGIKQRFYEAEHVTAATALVLTNICVMMNLQLSVLPFNKQILKINIKD
jgi:hypothetical protein